MARKTSGLWFALVVSLLLMGAQVVADQRPGTHPHEATLPERAHNGQQDTEHHQPAQPETHQDDDKAAPETTGGDNGHMMHGHHHRHDKWVEPPAAYANERSTRWEDPAAIARGKELFQTNCQVCHGVDGRGTGPAAKGLPHPPADLTNHFHRAPGDGDAYLFWRVSEGGQVEPFRSMQSVMPAFKTFLSVEQRWDVLAYVHAEFHRGFTSATMPASVTAEGNVIAVVPTSEQLVVQHGKIDGFMDAMTMGYKTNPPALLDGLHAGDRIRFTIDTRAQTIVKIEKLQP